MPERCPVCNGPVLVDTQSLTDSCRTKVRLYCQACAWDHWYPRSTPERGVGMTTKCFLPWRCNGLRLRS